MSEKVIRQFVKPQMVCVDIGAQKGYYTGVMCSLGAYVIAVEPNPVLADEINKMIVRNAYEAAVVVAAAGRGDSNAKKGDSEIFPVDWIVSKWFDKCDFAKIEAGSMALDVVVGMRKLFEDNPQLEVVMDVVTDNSRGYDLLPFTAWVWKILQRPLYAAHMHRGFVPWNERTEEVQQLLWIGGKLNEQAETAGV
jgi:FkbM family methyltransferase